MHCCCYEHGILSSLPSLKVWRPASSLPSRHLQIVHRVKAASRASWIDRPAFDRPAKNSHRKQQTSLEGPYAASRRHLLFGAASVFGSIGLQAPPEAEATQVLNVNGQADLEVFQFCVYLSVVALRGSVPNQWVEDFKQALGEYGILKLQQKGQLQDIYKELGQPMKKKSASRADVVTVGDSWLGPAIKAGYLQPLQDVDSFRWWDSLAPHWRRLVTRNLSGQADSKGQVWAVPYRWGCTLVAFNTDKLCRRGGVAIHDWSDLLQPRLKGRVAFLDSSRELVGVALKTVGLPYNCTYSQLCKSDVSLQQLQQRLQQLRDQVRLFSSRDHTRALAANDVWAIVGSSLDLIPLASRSSNVSITAPVSGTALWADLWTVPAHASGGSQMQGPSPLLPAWFEFALQPSRMQPSRGLQLGASPLQLPGQLSSSQEKHVVVSSSEWGSQLIGGVMPEKETLMRSEFLLPLDQETTAMYHKLLSA